MRSLIRTLVHVAMPLAIAAIAISAAVVAAASATPYTGLHMTYRDGRVVIDSVEYATAAQMSGLRPGDVVVTLNAADGSAVDVLGASDQVKRDVAASSQAWVFVETVQPELADAEVVERLKRTMSEAISQRLSTVLAPIYAAGQPPDYCGGGCLPPLPPVLYYTNYTEFHYLYIAVAGPGPLPLGLAILLLGWLLLRTGRAGEALRPYALSLPLATAAPFLAMPIDRYPTLLAAVVASVLVPLAMLPLAIDFLARIEGGRKRLALGVVVVGLFAISVSAGIAIPGGVPENISFRIWRACAAAAMPFVPGLVAARPSTAGFLASLPGRGRSASIRARLTPRAMVEQVDVLAASLTPAAATVSLWPAGSVELWPILVWLAVLLVATRFTLRPLMRLALSATRQRDLVVAATEAERARIAADIHDDALQDLTMLVRRLDAAGDLENAEAAREIAQRLRDICGDLRLPVLDDLGVGPALEWLCGRLGQSAGRITLDRLAEESRLPADVELAAFRVAQESLSNAIRHGAPPIVVRYRSGEGWIELEVDDSGPGLASDAAEKAELTGHLGLLNMAQRAEAIGATLKIGRRPGGGTRVSLVWERAVGPAAAPAGPATPATLAGAAAAPKTAPA
jgi:signal transduction histidine kinase